MWMWSWAEKKVQVVTSESKREKIQFGSSDTYLTNIQRQPLDDGDGDIKYNDNYNDVTKGGEDDDDDANYNDNDNYDDDTKGGEEVLVQGQPLKAAQTQEGFGWGHQHIQYLFKYLN